MDLTIHNMRTLHQLISDKAAELGDTIAIVYENDQLSYRELEHRSNQLANHLRANGVQPGVLVGLCIERSLDMMIGLLGILKSGGAYVPIDPAYPADRIGYMLEDSEAPWVLTQQAIAGSLPASDAATLCLDSDWPDIDSASTDLPQELAGPDDLAYVIYTSGSTGRPKGVEIQHHALVNFILSMSDSPGLSDSDRLLAVTTLSFDIAGLELYLPLTVGARLVIANRCVASDGKLLSAAIEQHQITVMQATPATWRLMLEANWQGAENLCILCGGEALPRDLAERLLPRCKVLWNMYGPTETTIWSTIARIESGGGSVPIGLPIANTEIWILDDNLTPVPAGTPGELYIGGDGLARGYFKREDLTAERFIDSPFTDDSGARLYRTGDLATQAPDGTLQHLGRVDFQVKVRGFRIELGEIEAALEQDASVSQAVVVAREDIAGDKRLVAYVRADKETQPTSRALRESISRRLPDYMVPGYYVYLDSFPLTPNGKIDRNALPAPDATRPELAEEYVAPRSEQESKLASIWSEVLRIEQVGINDNFFELGGDSLKVAQIATRIREVLLVDMPLRAMFDNPTITDLASVLDTFESSTGDSAELPISIVSRENDIPLTFSQERVWFLHQLNPNNLAYNFISTLEFTGALDVTAIEQTLGEILRRHESYRSSFPTVNGKPVQVIHPAEQYTLPIIDLTGMAEEAQQEKADAWSREEYQHRFNLAELPLVRWHLFRYSDDRHVLVHMEHHLVHDGWAFNLFIKEFTALYAAFSQGKPSPLAEPPIQLADFASWQHEWMQGEVSEQQLAYWKQKFQSIPPVLQLPTKGPRPSTQSFRGTSLRPEIDLDICNKLRALAREEGSTLFMVMLSAFIALLHRYTGESDIAVGTFFANRRASESESVIAMILNNVVIRATLEGNPTLRELMTQIRNVVLEDAAYQDVPFDRVVDAVQPKRDISMNPLFQVMFSFHDEPMPEQPLPGLDVRIKPVISNGSSKFDLGVIGIPHSAQQLGLAQGSENDGLTMIWEHNTDLFDTATIERMVVHYKRLLAGLVADPDTQISDLPLSDAAEQEQLLHQWNSTAGDYPLTDCLHELVEKQAAMSPDSVAVAFQANELTYRELDTRANQLANYLGTLGVGPNVLVGICVERSERMLIGLLGILKAGGTYVPIDPAFPRDRQAYMIEDAEISILITEGELCDDLPVDTVNVVKLDSAAETLSEQADQLLSAPAVTPDDLAYVIYTSGSTGRPKGVQIPHRAVVNFLSTMREKPGLTADDRLFAVTTLSFDIAGLELFLPLVVGAQVILSPRAVAVNATELAAQIKSTGATVMQATPSTWQMLLDSGWEGEPAFTALCGGEAFPRSLAEQLLPRVKELWNMYGPTETTIWSAVHRVEPGQGGVPIGKPIGNTRIYVLDQYDNPAPIGVVGELCIGGSGLASGYLKRPELTAEKFVDDPASGISGEKIYRTGDLARYDQNGVLECLGRVDHQIKLRGFRIELGEIESLLVQARGVTQAVVVMREDIPGDKRLTAYYLTDGANSPSTADLRAALKGYLPEYMIPTAFMELDSFPLTPNEKIDRNALPAPDISRPDLEQAYQRPEGELQEAIAAIWGDVLNLKKVGIRDNFFDLGGHSLMVIKVLARIQEDLGAEIEVSTMFEHPTIEELEQAVLNWQFNQVDDEDMLQMLEEIESA